MTMAQPNLPIDLGPTHVRAARALLAWSQWDLAKAAGVATSTVADFERGQRTPVPNNTQAMRASLEAAGVRFLPTGAVIGPAVPSVGPSMHPGVPIRWVDAEDLADWANRIDGSVSLATLLACLIRATHGPAVRLRFPSDESVHHPGWDGVTSTDTGSTYVPSGDAGWEVSSQRSKITQKATTDYRKRSSVPAPLVPAEAAYVFVTLRRWPQKDEWAKARQKDGVWREVRAYDVDDLVHWIEQNAAVGLWIATRLGKRPAGTQALEGVWKEWSLGTEWPLTEDLILADRDEDAAEVLRWLRGEPAVLSLKATSTAEVVAFFHATLSMLPADLAAAYRARSIVATTHTAARALANASAPLIVVLTEPEPGLSRILVEHGHYLLQAYDERPISRGEVRTLARPSREGIASALTAAGIAAPRAEALARDSARNLAVLRRLIPGAPAHLPSWARETPPRALLAALLAGGWDEHSDADRAKVEELADQPYEDVIAVLAPHVSTLDSPLEKVGSAWRIASPEDAWFSLAPFLTAADITRFETAAQAVLGSADPHFEMDSAERWMAAVRGVRPEYSKPLRHGIGQVLILLALWGDRARAVPGAAQRADTIVGNLLRNADQQRWWSLSREFRLLAEASPKAFLSAIEDSLDQSDPPIRALFGTDGGDAFGAEHLSDLLWALETLAWSPDLVSRVTHVLARLDALDHPVGRNLNRPANSLRQIHLLWVPQTCANLDERLRALDLIRKHESDAAWKVLLGVLPRGHDMSHPSPMPRWRDFTVDSVEVVTRGLIRRGAAAISERLLADVGVNSARWSSLLDRLSDLTPDPEAALTALEEAVPKITHEADRALLWTKLRGVLHDHRPYPTAECANTTEVLGRLAALYERLEPPEPLARRAWLFEQRAFLPKSSVEGWEAAELEIDTARREAAKAVYSEGGATAVLRLARLVGTAGYIGKALHDSGVSESDLDALIEAALRSDDTRERDVAHGLIVSLFPDRQEPWAAALIARTKGEAWGATALLTILRALPTRRWTWDRVAEAGEEIERSYWQRTPVFRVAGNAEDVTIAIRKLISVGRARFALALAHLGNEGQLPSDLLMEVLREAARQPFENDGDANEATMFQYHVTQTLHLLDERNDVSMDDLVAIEWLYLPVLEHSRRPAKVLLRALSEQPALFVQLLRAVFRAREASGVVDEEPANPEAAPAVASQAYRLLELWNCIPGTGNDGTIDSKALRSWIEEARSLSQAAAREEMGDHQIGTMLSASPLGADGNWPHEAVRDAIDLFRSKPMIDGFVVGRRNRRGVTVRAPRDGGILERQEAAKYRRWTKAISFDHPQTAKALEELADEYESESHRHDEDAERRDWDS